MIFLITVTSQIIGHSIEKVNPLYQGPVNKPAFLCNPDVTIADQHVWLSLWICRSQLLVHFHNAASSDE